MRGVTIPSTDSLEVGFSFKHFLFIGYESFYLGNALNAPYKITTHRKIYADIRVFSEHDVGFRDSVDIF